MVVAVLAQAWMLLASEMTAAMPQGVGVWFSLDDVPVRLLVKRETRAGVYRAIITPDGRLQGCEVEVESGNDNVDAYTCALVRSRAKYSPARWIDGSFVYGVDRLKVVWRINNSEPVKALKHDAELIVRKRPRGVTFVPVMVAVDERGQILSCAVEPPERHSTKGVDGALAQLACSAVISQFRPKPARDARGNPVRSVQTAAVDLKRW